MFSFLFPIFFPCVDGCLCELFLLEHELYVIINLSVWSFSMNYFFDHGKNCLSLLFIITIYKQKCFTFRRWILIFACSTDKQPAKYITHNKRTHWLLSWPVVYTKTKTKLNWTSQIRFGKEPLESRAQEEPHCIRTHRRHMNKTHCFNTHMLMKTYWPYFFLFLFCWSFFFFHLLLSSFLYFTFHFVDSLWVFKCADTFGTAHTSKHPIEAKERAACRDWFRMPNAFWFSWN